MVGIQNGVTIGINGGGRMGKGMLRLLVSQRLFPKIILNFGREVGCGLEDIINYIISDTTYGNLSLFANGVAGWSLPVSIINDSKGVIRINDTDIHIKREHRNPKDIDWEDATVVIDTTGKYNNPTKKVDAKKGSVRGHLEYPSVEKVLISSPLKGIENGTPSDTIMMSRGINSQLYDPEKHNIISGASCTTTALARMLKALVEDLGAQNLLSMTVTSVHAVTGKETLMDKVPPAGVNDPVFFQAAGDNMFISTTGAAKALAVVMPEVANVPQMAEAVREPGITGSLVILTTDWDLEFGEEVANRIFLQNSNDPNSYLQYVSTKISRRDIFASPAAVTVAGADSVSQCLNYAGTHITRLRTFGFYDNEFGYTSMLLELLKKIVAEL